MKMLFVNPNLSGDYSSMDIALTVLATQVNLRSNHSAFICDLTFNRHRWREYIEGYIHTIKPDVIGMSLNNLHMAYARDVGQYIYDRQKPPRDEWDIPIIVGGHHVSTALDGVLKEPWVAVAFTGDSEESLIQSLNDSWCSPNHIVSGFRDNLDDLPIPNWTLWPTFGKYMYFLGGMMYVIGSRGCPHQCSFCLAPEISKCVSGNYFRQRDPVKFADELGQMSRVYAPLGARFFQVFDPVFTIDPAWVHKFTQQYDGFPYSVFARIDQLDEQRISDLALSGCKVVRVGIENGNEDYRNTIYHKGVSNTQIYDIAQMCHRYKMNMTAYYILGGPGESQKTLDDTIAMARKVDAARSVFFVYKPFTKEGIQQVEEAGGKILEGADNITFGAAIDPSPTLKAETVLRYQKKAYFLTFGKRWLGIVKRDGLGYFTSLAKYLWKGTRAHLPLSYLVAYFHCYIGKNVDS
jgi:radical SAM superfamily enzyme YgiQ (UPF0313 family)